MSKMVSARVPDAVYDQASAQLASMGASTSELINAAYEYLLHEHDLPRPQQKNANTERRLSPAQANKLKELFAACTLDIDIPSDVSYDKQAIRESREAKHEALA